LLAAARVASASSSIAGSDHQELFVSGIVQGGRAIKETGIGLAGKREGRDAEEHDCRKKDACTLHGEGRETWRQIFMMWSWVLSEFLDRG
jgi:hypothetical protein